jgi:tetraacyldisaccharide 4'-kinase
LDIVVMRPEWDISTAHMLPKGRLREPPSALKRADVLWLHHKATTPPNIPNWLPTEKQHCTSFTKYHLLDISDNLADVLLLQNVIGVCGVAHPPAFFNVLDPLVQHCCAKVAYPDHHQFSIQDVDRLLETMKHHAATACVVTPKDAIKLRELWPPAETKQLLVLHNEVHLSTLCDEWQLFFHILPSVWQRTPTMHDNSIS